MGGGRSAVIIGAALAGMLGCARPPPHRSDALARSRAVLDAADRLEAELHTEAEAIDLYADLGARRKSATEVTCQVADRHIKEIERLADAQKRTRREKARLRREHKLALLQAAANAKPDGKP